MRQVATLARSYRFILKFVDGKTVPALQLAASDQFHNVLMLSTEPPPPQRSPLVSLAVFCR